LEAAAPKIAYPSLADSRTAEVVVVGGGIVGLTAAYLLARAGLPVVLLEARRIGRQVTGGSTAKITTQHHLSLSHRTFRFRNRTALFLDEDAMHDGDLTCGATKVQERNL
jgi:glycine/D-amino acid oxidase-like deaminating enzyme